MDTSDKGRFGLTASATMALGASIGDGIRPRTRYDLELFDPGGQLKWRESFYNTVVNVGLDDVLTQYLKGSAYTAAFYVGLVSSTPTIAATDTMAAHAGWTEVTSYAEATRQTLTLGAVSGQSVDNSASKAVFSINAGVTIGGAFITTVNTKSGTTGTLFSAAAFTAGNRAALAGDTLNVTATISAASA